MKKYEELQKEYNKFCNKTPKVHFDEDRNGSAWYNVDENEIQISKRYDEDLGGYHVTKFERVKQTDIRMHLDIDETKKLYGFLQELFREVK